MNNCVVCYCSYTPTSFHMQWMHVTVNEHIDCLEQLWLLNKKYEQGFTYMLFRG